MRQAVILAAGMGRRLNGVANGYPKCLVRVGGVPLLEWQLQMLRGVGIDRIAIVVGYHHEQIREFAGDRCEYIINSRYSSTNSLYSLWLARTWVDGPFVLINGDVFAHPLVYQRLSSVDGCALTFDGSSGDDEEHMKVTMRGKQVQGLGKDLSAADVDGENVGLLQFDTAGAKLLFEEADHLIGAGGEGSWAPAAVDKVVKRIQFRVAPTPKHTPPSWPTISPRQSWCLAPKSWCITR